MHRTQIQLTEEQVSALKAIGAKENRSMADLIRESVEQLISRRRPVDRQKMMIRALSVIGKYSGGPGDVSENHDEYLAEAILASKPRPKRIPRG